MTKNRITLSDVAGAAGVSVATVSKVLNDRRDVSAQTRRRVLRHLHAASYRPVGSDSALRRQGMFIEVVFPDAQNSYSIAVLEGITDGAQTEGLEVVVGRKFGSRGSRSDIDPELLLKSGRAGAIFITMDPTSAHLRILRDADFAVVVVDPLRLGEPDCVSIGATNFAGGVAATEYLLSLGHQRIGHAGGPDRVDCSHARLAGYTSALRQAGVEFDESLIMHCSFHYEQGRSAAGQLLDRDDPPTAIFAGNDEIALGVMEEARRRSIRVPEDLSVVGFDDTFMATRSAPQLTTVAQPLVEMGRVAIRSLARMINHESVGSNHIELATRLVIRDSTAPRR
ncbi:MAG: LacI family DNA-binding transcriptional regulator [Propionibacteriaceae bacterium]